MPPASARDSWRELSALALRQGGYFTSAQARALGYERQHLHHHRQRGTIETPAHGVHRLVAAPLEADDELLRVMFQIRSREGEPAGTLSHATALRVHGLGDLLLDEVHVTVGDRRRRIAPAGVVLHRATLRASDTEPWRVGRVTTPLRSLIDAADTPGFPADQLETAAREAVALGLIGERRIREAGHRRLTAALDGRHG